MKNNKNNTAKVLDLESVENAIHFEFSESIDLRKVFEVMKYSVGSIGNWLKALESTRGGSFEFAYSIDEDSLSKGIPVICKAIVEAFPAVCFSGHAWYDSVKCYSVDEFEFSYDGSTLRLKENIYNSESGYFCPECGYVVAYANEVIDGDEIECDDCGEILKVSDLKYVAPYSTETIINFSGEYH